MKNTDIRTHINQILKHTVYFQIARSTNVYSLQYSILNLYKTWYSRSVLDGSIQPLYH